VRFQHKQKLGNHKAFDQGYSSPFLHSSSESTLTLKLHQMSASGTIVVAGYGPGIARAVALKFGTQGHKVALLARTQASLDAAVAGE
jgi:hypothetical protein